MMTTSMAEEERITSFSFFIIVLCALITCTTAADTISANQTIRNGETILSAKQTFELGFFNPENSTKWYVGIWYKRTPPATQTVMWVANRNSPLPNNSGELSLTPQGILVLRNATGDIIWLSANSSLPLVRKPVAQLLDSGNFIVQEENGHPENPIWQSFDFPTDTLFAGMKLGKDLVTGLERYLMSWKSENDPSLGDYTLWVDTKGYPQMIIRYRSDIFIRVGPWNGLRFSGLTNLRPNSYFRFGFVLDQREMYYHFDDINSSVSRLVMQPAGSLERLLWKESQQEWSLYLAHSTENCNRYGLCGSFSSCNVENLPPCGCLEGFEPTSPDQWNAAVWSQGCRRSTPLDCGPGDGFQKYSSLMLPDTQESWFNQSMNLDECKMVCKKNCSCTAYTTQNITGTGSGCLLWFGDLIDIRTLPHNGQDLYIRMPASELAKGKSSSVNKRVAVIVPIISILLVILLSMCVFYRIKKWKAKQEGTVEGDYGDDSGNKNPKDDVELPFIDFSTLRKATNNFSDNNKLGQGGFGPVYKGVLGNGQEVAVKHLSKTSTQGLDEFKNEVIFISKLQHRNLVKLLGCCIKGEEKMLVYEYMPNKGLDSFIFDGAQDFGMARCFGGNQIEENTNRVVGTYGYMAPEYAGDEDSSTKNTATTFSDMHGDSI
ncbi:hypothetical protein L6452_28682 [Arctium lappa]|uniref:Uncharacterized protein n=1 Tax=Arctium lappa TaxID=4217 RepID=A0ACB8ZZ61_ARCLA|nr:hypothetical protein L6452_28682 [Arctium lappa]